PRLTHLSCSAHITLVRGSTRTGAWLPEPPKGKGHGQASNVDCTTGWIVGVPRRGGIWLLISLSDVRQFGRRLSRRRLSPAQRGAALMTRNSPARARYGRVTWCWEVVL